jgi:hypothetical protein
MLAVSTIKGGIRVGKQTSSAAASSDATAPATGAQTEQDQTEREPALASQ